MGMYTVVLGSHGDEWQIKAGNDSCDRYELGDKVPQTVSQTQAGEGDFLDGVYHAYGPEQKEGWVVIQDAALRVLVTVMEDDPGAQRERLEQEYGVAFDRALWSQKLWDEHAQRLKVLEDEFFEQLAKVHGVSRIEYQALSPTNRLAIDMAMSVEQVIGEKSFARKIFSLKEQTDGE